MTTSDRSVTSINGTDSSSKSKASSMTDPDAFEAPDALSQEELTTTGASGGENKAKLVLSILRQ